MRAQKHPFLFSVDLEDLRFRVPNGLAIFPDNLVQLVSEILAFLERHDFRTTFFVVGDVAEHFPDLLRRLAGNGHEIAWHSHRHTPLIQQTPDVFRRELQQSLTAFEAAGIDAMRGFRAPYFSMTEATQWAYPILQEYGFTYSSSVLAARRQRYAWPQFGTEKRKVGALWELPMTVADIGITSLPFAGGAYLRSLPLPLLRALCRRAAKKERPVLSYIHPYDLDHRQKLAAFPDAHIGRLTNFFLHYNRKNVIARLEALVEDGAQIVPYRDYIASLED